MAKILSIRKDADWPNHYRVEFDEPVDLSASGCAAPDTVWHMYAQETGVGDNETKEFDEFDIYLQATRAMQRNRKDQGEANAE